MSWDIFVQDLPQAAVRVADIPDDFVPQPVGARAAIIERIRAEFPQVDFRDPAWGVLDTGAFSIEINLGPDELVRAFAMHVRGGPEAVDVVAAMLSHLNLRAIDSTSGELFSLRSAKQSYARWSQYRDGIV